MDRESEVLLVREDTVRRPRFKVGHARRATTPSGEKSQMESENVIA